MGFKNFSLTFILTLFISLIGHFVQADIVKVSNLDKIWQDFQTNYNKNYLAKDILVMVALDDLLFSPAFPTKDNVTRDEYNRFKKIIEKVISNRKGAYLTQVILTNYARELRYQNFPEFINNISSNGTPIIALNKGFTGNFNKIPKFEIWLADYLKKDFNIDFSHSFPPKSNYIIFNNIPSIENTYPVFYKGILVSNNIPEIRLSNLILELLIETKVYPKLFIMISSDHGLLTSTEAQIASYNTNIKCLGYHIQDMNADKKINPIYLEKLLNNLLNDVNKVQRKNPSVKRTKYQKPL